MGAGYVHKCNKCGYSVYTSGPWEFYRDSKGERKPYGHPSPMSEEARERGIYGFSGVLYCPDCDEVFDLILVELNEPSAVKCPKCGNENMILDPVGDKEVTCPSCKEGKLVGRMEWIS